MQYVVQPGDTLFLIARRFGTTVAAILAANPQITDPNRIFVGQVITIPVTPPVPTPPPTPPPGVRQYVVQPGDTLFLIARRFGTTVPAILAANPQITDPNVIFPGQIINIPVAVPPTPPPTTPTPPPTPTPMPTPPPPGRYVVQPGDTLFLIARRFGTTVAAILAVNPQITDPNLIFPGQIITIP
ncbi:MAG: LysM peptidoglycan-binding domain-containing protein [Clostridia bacterium]|nr:LysM peptidoglycan-binding domain-containing protein [Clostridia bacterium]